LTPGKRIALGFAVPLICAETRRLAGRFLIIFERGGFGLTPFKTTTPTNPKTKNSMSLR
jgi:hypothetical protein